MAAISEQNKFLKQEIKNTKIIQIITLVIALASLFLIYFKC
jgi:hypothetical protein